MMERYSGDFLASVDGLRALLGCEGRVWPVTVETASICAEYGDGSQTRGEVEIDAGQSAGNAIWDFTAGDAVRLIGKTIGRPVDVALINTARPSPETLERYRAEHKRPLEIGDVPSSCDVVTGEFWCKDIARHDRRRLAHAVWALLSKRLL
jgi:2-phospho-L-lactate transferase/gluconeogenesis factor (CofD/UPF0052 family)